MSAATPLGRQASGTALRRILSPALFPAALFAMATGLVVAGLAWPSLTLVPRESRTRAAATALLERVETAERAWALAQRRYAPLPADTGAAAATQPDFGLTPGETRDFLVDVLPKRDGSLRLRVVSRPEAIREGRVTPLEVAMTLPALAPPQDAPSGIPGAERPQ